MVRWLIFAVALTLTMSLAACGLKGDLYLPKPEKSPEQTKNAP